jgi:hypothetical protein
VQCTTLPSASARTHTAHTLIFYFLFSFSNLFPKKKKQESEEQWSRERHIYLAAKEHHWIGGFQARPLVLLVVVVTYLFYYTLDAQM